MLIGDSGVGKTCILVRFKNNTFLGGSFISTVGIDFRVSNDYLLSAKKLLYTYIFKFLDSLTDHCTVMFSPMRRYGRALAMGLRLLVCHMLLHDWLFVIFVHLHNYFQTVVQTHTDT